MTPKTIRLFIKPGCPWCVDAVEWLDARGWDYERPNPALQSQIPEA